MPEVFIDRIDAGRKLAGNLRQYESGDAIVLAIPRGGVPVAVEVALHLNLSLDLVVPRKLPIPWNPEAGFGAVTSDGALVLNELMVKELGLSRKRIKEIANDVMDEVQRRERVLRDDLPKIDIKGKQAIIVDDGLASGYTMLAAIRSARQAGASRIIVAVPVASLSAARIIREATDELIITVQSERLPFAVADYYLEWHDLTDTEVLEYLNRYLKEHPDNLPR